MVRTLLLVAAWALVVLLGGWGVPLGAEGLEICDDFEDGDVLDGTPVCWERSPALPTIFEVEGGDLRIRNTAVWIYGALIICDDFSGDISIRALARIEDANRTGGLHLFVHFDRVSSAYVAEFHSSGQFNLVRFDPGTRNDIGLASIPGFIPENEHIFEFSVRGDMLEARVWDPDTPVPAEPLVSVRDTKYRTGVAGVAASDPENLASSFRGVFHSVCISTFEDCNKNGSPDESDIAAGSSQDCNGNGIPDECDIAAETSKDCNGNGVPDDCDLASGRSYDCDGDGALDDCEVSPFPSSLSANTTGMADSTFLGPPDGIHEGLGGKSVTYDLGQAQVADGTGVDFTVYEGGTALDAEFTSIDVLVSADGERFTSVKTSEIPAVQIPGDEGASGILLARSYDLGPSGLAAARYIRIQGSGDEPAGEGRGFDLDAAGVLHLTLCSGPQFRRCDANVDGLADISDAVFVLNYLFTGGRKPTCEKAADANDDGKVDISDAVFHLGYLFLGGKAPDEPLGSCGVDPTLDQLTCESFAKCP